MSSKDLDTKLNPSVLTENGMASEKIVQPGGIKTGFLFAFILTAGLGSFQFGKI
jgi:hypothetical protein